VEQFIDAAPREHAEALLVAKVASFANFARLFCSTYKLFHVEQSHTLQASQPALQVPQGFSLGSHTTTAELGL
jgi:hypothetical protein